MLYNVPSAQQMLKRNGRTLWHGRGGSVAVGGDTSCLVWKFLDRLQILHREMENLSLKFRFRVSNRPWQTLAANGHLDVVSDVYISTVGGDHHS